MCRTTAVPDPGVPAVRSTRGFDARLARRTAFWTAGDFSRMPIRKTVPSTATTSVTNPSSLTNDLISTTSVGSWLQRRQRLTVESPRFPGVVVAGAQAAVEALGQ